jgi:hypothetical protein
LANRCFAETGNNLKNQVRPCPVGCLLIKTYRTICNYCTKIFNLLQMKKGTRKEMKNVVGGKTNFGKCFSNADFGTNICNPNLPDNLNYQDTCIRRACVKLYC